MRIPSGSARLFDRVVRKCKHRPFERWEVDFTRCLSFGSCTSITKCKCILLKIFVPVFVLEKYWTSLTGCSQTEGTMLSRYSKHLHILPLRLAGVHLRETRQTRLKAVNWRSANKQAILLGKSGSEVRHDEETWDRCCCKVFMECTAQNPVSLQRTWASHESKGGLSWQFDSF